MHDPVTRPRGRRQTDREEANLLARFRAGDERVFAALFRPHLETLKALARRTVRDPHWADDLVQETLVRAYRGLAEFRGEAALGTWASAILLRLAAEPRRFGRTAPTASLEGLEIPDGLGPAPDDPALGRELRDRLEEALERLSPRQRAALHLRAAEGLGYEGIGAVLGCSAGAARMLVLEARRRVRARMGRYLEP